MDAQGDVELWSIGFGKKRGVVHVLVRMVGGLVTGGEPVALRILNQHLCGFPVGKWGHERGS